MRRLVVTAAGLALLGACNLFGPDDPVPAGFEGWFHLDRPGRATSMGFAGGNVAVISDLGCDGNLIEERPWITDGAGLVLPDWPNSPRFTPDPSRDAGLVASPGMYGSAVESWMNGASCLLCPAADAGLAVACSQPQVLDGGT